MTIPCPSWYVNPKENFSKKNRFHHQYIQTLEYWEGFWSGLIFSLRYFNRWLWLKFELFRKKSRRSHKMLNMKHVCLNNTFYLWSIKPLHHFLCRWCNKIFQYYYYLDKIALLCTLHHFKDFIKRTGTCLILVGTGKNELLIFRWAWKLKLYSPTS